MIQALAPMTTAVVFRRLLGECRRFSGRLALLAASLVVLALARLYLTWLVKVWSETLLSVGDHAGLAPLMETAAVVTSVVVAAIFASLYLMSSLHERLGESLRNDLQDRLLSLNVPTLRRLHSGDLMSRAFNDVQVLAAFARDVLKRLIGEGLVLAGSVAMMFYLEWRIALAICLLAPLVAVVVGPLGRSIRHSDVRARESLGGLAATLIEQLRGVTTIKGYRAERFERQRFASENAAYRGQAMRSAFWFSLLLSSVWLITGIGLVASLWYGGHRVLAGTVSPGGLLAFCLYAAQTIEPLRHLGEVHAVLQRGVAAAARVFGIIDLPDTEAEGDIDLAAARGEIRFEHVSFHYRSDQPVLHHIDLKIEARETIALVATSGGGKSTVASLLVRYLEPQEGRVVLDGVEISRLRLAALRRNVCVVEQEPFLFSGPLIDNLRYGSRQASRREIESAVEAVGLADLVRGLPAGLDEPLVEAGRDLSGGQRQRIALARAVLREPAVLVLDEATSAIDSDTEGLIFEHLQNWFARRTVLVMAHRYSTVARFPRVVVLADGRIVGDGAPAELAGSCAPFRRLFGEQLQIVRPDRPAVAS